MSEQFHWCPSPPGYRVDWEAVEREFPAVGLMGGCPQDAVHHAEGDVRVHTEMVVGELVSMPAWRALARPEREIVFTAALLHDEVAREHLRRRRPFVWNATNISRQMREISVNLFAAYNARVRIVYVEAPEERLFAQNRERADSVPAEVIRKLTARWEVPDLTEAHRVDWATGSPGAAQLLTF